MAEITLERLRELQEICSKMDPGRRRKWKLEVYTLRNGREILTESIDLKVGRPVKNYKRKADND